MDEQVKYIELERVKRAKINPSCGVIDPAIKIIKTQSPNTPGRKVGIILRGINAGFANNARQPGQPVLRRDPTAIEKLSMLRPLEKKAKELNCTVLELPAEWKRKWEACLTMNGGGK